MCERGSWRGFDTVHKTQEHVIIAIEQCTECDNYRSRDITDMPAVVENSNSQIQQTEDLPDPTEYDDETSPYTVD